MSTRTEPAKLAEIADRICGDLSEAEWRGDYADSVGTRIRTAYEDTDIACEAAAEAGSESAWASDEEPEAEPEDVAIAWGEAENAFRKAAKSWALARKPEMRDACLEAAEAARAAYVAWRTISL